ncbi:hypothetical protein BO83DRAFT_137614 [Aspergillus eucalypticola CBS 122712]|uniref:Uncharacterized protein n=1 Tax=Aspergillus eucalypticola (strain CBS 122712 / IBT 29274) TaxID=1448314 RepID=A0A317USU7_ASPEC|nr:uncharacterized protein BO83DRAFT_137614 [Aspergillus eucalypticola CBS 122712]PWY64601.1 hypothetical protein BO83DRAFT_137614 [Aspergillus eucalypticola CBS 122712]
MVVRSFVDRKLSRYKCYFRIDHNYLPLSVRFRVFPLFFCYFASGFLLRVQINTTYHQTFFFY